MSVFLSFCLSVCLSVFLSVCLSVDMSVFVKVCAVSWYLVSKICVYLSPVRMPGNTSNNLWRFYTQLVLNSFTKTVWQLEPEVPCVLVGVVRRSSMLQLLLWSLQLQSWKCTSSGSATILGICFFAIIFVMNSCDLLVNFNFIHLYSLKVSSFIPDAWHE